MSDEATAHVGAAEHGLGVRTVLVIVGAALIFGVGWFFTAYWLISAFAWKWFVGLPLLVIGGLLLFSRLTGPDHA
ncbi:MAG TPA: hypothetical protein VMG36_01900 [Thermoplasmata archaeon]|nr:hypothetical protein [Thermoplasmata archaeon]